MAYPDHMRPIEARIIDQILDKAPGRVSVHYEDDAEPAVGPTTDRDLITAEIAACSSTTLRLEGLGWIYLVHGNDEDVICDYTYNLAMEEFINSIDTELERRKQLILDAIAQANLTPNQLKELLW